MTEPPDNRALAKQIATQLNEPQIGLVRGVVEVCGPERAMTYLARTLEIEQSGGLLTLDGTQRRTPGGVFFYTVKGNTSVRERRRIFGWRQPQPPQPQAQPDGETQSQPLQSEQPDQEPLAQVQSQPAAQPQPKAPAQPKVVAPTWDEAKQLIIAAYRFIAEAKTVKLTLIGRPSQITEQGSCVVMAMKGKPPGNLPAGLPTPPVQSAITWAVFVATKQWNKVKTTLDENAEDELIIEGYPMVDPKRGVGVVLASNCTSKAIQRATREAKQT
jgi:hypothetical protein